MADLIAYQDGNWTGATTWKGVATGANAKQATITASTNTTTSNVASSNFTIGNGTVCEGLLLHCNRVTTTGTVTVGLYDGTTLQREVTINASDLPTAQSWVFFKFATTFTAGNASTYNVRVRGSSAGNATFFRDGTAGNWARYVRNNTTTTAAASDVTFICDELTGAGTKVDVTVTMNSTASTAYGECNIGQGGILSYGTSASTNYILDLGGNLNVWGGGTLNIGTSGTRIPSTSTALLEFTMGTNVLYGLEARSGSTVNIYGAEKSNTKTLLTADANSGQAVINVTSTTGWAVNDLVAIATTTRTPGASESGTVSVINSGTQATLSSNLLGVHHGTGLYVGEVVNLTRNVKIRGTSISLCAYVNCEATSSFTASYAEFFWLGSGTSSKRGITAATSSVGSFSMTFCSIRDFNSNSYGWEFTGASGSPIVDDCVAFYQGGGQAFWSAPTAGTPSFQRNYILSTIAGCAFGDLNGTIEDNRFAGPNITFGESLSTPTTLQNNIIHSASNGLVLNSNLITLNNFTIWRCSLGVDMRGASTVFSNCSFYHNVSNFTSQFSNSRGEYVKFINCAFNGGSGAGLSQTARHIQLGALNLIRTIFENCTFGATTQATTFLEIGNSANAEIIFRRCTVAETISITTQNLMVTFNEFEGFIAFDKFNNTSGSHRTYKRYGRTEADQATFKTAAPSEALLPNTSGQKLPSGSKKFAVASGTTATVKVWVNKSASYNGNQPRLIVKANSIAGIASDTVLDTMSVGTGTWEELSGTTATVSDDCVLEVYVDCDGTAGTVYVDDWSVT